MAKVNFVDIPYIIKNAARVSVRTAFFCRN